MLPWVREGESGPLLVWLHWLGGSARTWHEVNQKLAARGVECVALDLPGFGEACGAAGYSKAAMAEAVVETLRELQAESRAAEGWVLVGHSMGGAVAGIVARRALDGEAGLEGLRGLVLVSPSPPGPEPMTEQKRRESLELLGESTRNPAEDRRRAANFVEKNVGVLPLPAEVHGRAVEDVLRMNRTAFRMWMEHGSREDWSGFVSVLDLPAVVFAGTEDAALGPPAQREHMLPYLGQGRIIEMEGAGHLGPLERPGLLVEYVTQFLAGAGCVLQAPQRAPGRAFAALMEGERTSPVTRAVMSERLAAAQRWAAEVQVFNPAELRTLRALVERVVPRAGFDLAARVDALLAETPGDGWRPAVLPPDTEAWRCGLRSLDAAAWRAHGVEFLGLFPAQQDALLEAAAKGALGRGVLGALHVGEGAKAFTGEQMEAWFEDVRGLCARLYMADPRTMERVGYTGFADDLGFTQIELGQREEFER